jgi:hypothetical protein
MAAGWFSLWRAPCDAKVGGDTVKRFDVWRAFAPLKKSDVGSVMV